MMRKLSVFVGASCIFTSLLYFVWYGIPRIAVVSSIGEAGQQCSQTKPSMTIGETYRLMESSSLPEIELQTGNSALFFWKTVGCRVTFDAATGYVISTALEPVSTTGTLIQSGKEPE
jgi:hypothetical protein